MRTRIFLTSLIVVGLLATPALAAGAPHGRGPKAQAAMLAETAGTFSQHPVRVLNQICDHPGTRQGCVPIKANLRAALERAFDAPITWVDPQRHQAGQLWVLGTVVFDGTQVTTKVAWRDAGPVGCFGWTRLSWKRHHGAWSVFRGISVEGCSAAV
jgi:hypothetical protein